MWRLADEPSADLDDSKVQSILSALAGYVTAQITDADPSAYGFAAPLATVRAASADGTVTLHYAENADGCWMMVEGDSSVYAVDLDTVQALLIPAAALKAEYKPLCAVCGKPAAAHVFLLRRVKLRQTLAE